MTDTAPAVTALHPQGAVPRFPEDKCLTSGEVALSLSVSEETVWRLIASGELRAGKVGRGWRILQSDLDAFCRNVWQ